jgi:ribosome biogenesis GTPase / thiamine phosphate phosphatase
MPKGLITKALSGFYYVEEEESKTIYECRGRGVFRNQEITPLVGDRVEFQIEAHTKGYVNEIKERKNELIRPQIANVDHVLLVFSVKNPEFNQALLDRFLSIIEACGITPIIILTKWDLLDTFNEVDEYITYYQSIGYQIIKTSKFDADVVDLLKSVIDDRISVLAGQSGVGKSSLLNAINPEFQLHVNEISKALGRGKHTTRHVELFKVSNGLVADTPGFSSLDFKDFSIDEVELAQSFVEFFELSHACKFRGCTHINEPKCKVKEQLGKSKVFDNRYKHYHDFHDEINNQRAVYIKKSK